MTAITPLLVVVVCAASSGSALAERKIDLAQLRVGSHCELQTKVSEDGRSRTTYLGTVKDLSDTSVTLHDVSQTNHADRSTPVLATIPYLKRFFRNVGVGRTHLGEKVLAIPLKDIAWNEAVAEKEFRMRTDVARGNRVRSQ
jgi:hypothetical protein